jgi:hypothetical protein
MSMVISAHFFQGSMAAKNASKLDQCGNAHRRLCERGRGFHTRRFTNCCHCKVFPPKLLRVTYNNTFKSHYHCWNNEKQQNLVQVAQDRGDSWLCQRYLF